jgi:hypothetical protein
MINALAASGPNIFAATPFGVYASTNEGATWNGENIGLNTLDIRTLCTSGPDLFAGTHGGGVWKRPLNEIVTSVGKHPDSVPRDFILLQNYPNPFNPVTTIRFEIPSASHVVLRIYDTVGREIASLVNGILPAGVHSREWRSDGHPSGVYYCRISARSGSSMTGRPYDDVLKLILAK